MKIQLKNILLRLKNPSVIISVASQIISLLLLLNVNVDRGVITTAITTICSVLVLLGIMSNPDTKTKGYGDDLYECSSCHQTTAHVRVGGSLICPSCGCVNGSCTVPKAPENPAAPQNQ